jgi:ABC-type phosphonate transport system ATPase subunit
VVDEEGQVRDNASDGLRRARAACAAVERRLRAALQRLPGDIITHAGRLCVAVPEGLLHHYVVTPCMLCHAELMMHC